MIGAVAGRFTVVRVLVGRLLLRDRAPVAWLGWVVLGSWVGVLVGLGLVWISAAALVPIAFLAVASSVAIVATVLRGFPPSTAVAILGAALACGSLMTSLSVATGFQQEIVSAMTVMNGHVLLTKYGLDFYEYDDVVRRAFGADPRIRAASPFAFSMAAVVGPVAPPAVGGSADKGWDVDGSRESGQGPSIVVCKGLDPRRAAQFEGLPILFDRGDLRSLRPGDSRHGPGIALGRTLARELGVRVGDFVRLVAPPERDDRRDLSARPPRWATFEVLDTFRTGTLELDRNLALVHLSAAQAIFFGRGRVTGIELQLTHPNDAAEVADILQTTFGFPYRLSTWFDSNQALLVSIFQIRIVLCLILGLMALVASSSVVASLMLIAYRKRRDMAVLMALGAERSVLFWTFEVLGLAIGGLGSCIGMLAGALACFILSCVRIPLDESIAPIAHLPVLVTASNVLVPALLGLGLCAAVSGPIAAAVARVLPIHVVRR